jgi:hypothetical protein
VKDALAVFFTASCWSQNHPYSALWDARLNRLLREFHFTDITEHTAKLGDYKIWIDNHPYASFTPYGMGVPEVRPRRATILRAYKQLLADGFGNDPDEQIMELERMMGDRAE